MATKMLKTLKFPDTNQVYEIVDDVGRLKSSLNAIAIETKQDKLISKINIKSINGQSLLGDGNLEIVPRYSQTPSGADLSANILALTEDTGIWIGIDTGFWYYWDMNNLLYRSGGEYLEHAEVINEQVEINKTNIETNTLAIADNALAIKNKKTFVVQEGLPDSKIYDMWFETKR